MLNTIRLVQKHLNPDLEIEGILITMYDNRLKLSRQVVEEVKNYFDDKVYNTFIKRNVRLGEAQVMENQLYYTMQHQLEPKII